MNNLNFLLVFIVLLTACFSTNPDLVLAFNNRQLNELRNRHQSVKNLTVKKSKVKQSMIKYNLVVEDIVRMVDWTLDSDIDAITAAELLNGLSTFDTNRQPSSDLIVYNNHSYHQFESLKSKSSIHQITISSDYPRTKKIKRITVIFNEYYNSNFSVDKFNHLISSEREIIPTEDSMLYKIKIRPNLLQKARNEQNVYLRFWIDPVSKSRKLQEIIIRP